MEEQKMDLILCQELSPTRNQIMPMEKFKKLYLVEVPFNQIDIMEVEKLPKQVY